MTRFDAYVALLTLPDAADLPRRARHYTQPGKANRQTMKVTLERAWLRHRMHAAGEEAVILSVRRAPVQLVRRRA